MNPELPSSTYIRLIRAKEEGQLGILIESYMKVMSQSSEAIFNLGSYALKALEEGYNPTVEELMKISFIIDNEAVHIHDDLVKKQSH